ncbi:calcium-binding protein [Bifidobacterium italicum]|uniref:Calcium-binding protein n=1 Tax=Bifidobacterium italicum TaxID=1960968 RepID=A0A2A2EFV1_9BIFI|nr:DUF1524 domain-containing protein [Bifidobacterium italicum]PAU67778.1 calcium-binding protein [Bifidobacterium italicum]
MSIDVFRKSIALFASAGLLLSLGACSMSSPSSADVSSSASSSETGRNQSVSDDGSSDEKPSPSAQASEEPELKVPEGSALDVLEQLPVKGRAPKTGYSRDQFGPAWSDVDHNGCDTRNDILNRDMSDKTYKANTHDCVVATGVLNDPYTGKRINFTRGQDTSTAVQIDHVVALSNAWQTGAQQLSEATRTQFANDPYNLLAVDGPANQQKSDGDAATWLPANKSFRCEYVARQIGVKKKYDLWVTQGEHDAMKNVLSSCPTQQVPSDGGVVTPLEVQESAPAPAQDENVYYKNCAAVRAAGKAPLHRGDPGYAPKLDRDGDGIACE